MFEHTYTQPRGGEGRQPALLFPTGRQFVIRSGETQATITEVGATLRSFSVGRQEFLDGFAEDEHSTDARGQVLIPFPNRIDHGQYRFQGRLYQLPLDEPSRFNALHGLTRWVNWQVIRQEEHRLVMALVLYEQEGYPFVLSLQITYSVGENRLEIQTTACNSGSTPLPYGTGYHPYLTVGTQTINKSLLRLPARSYFPTNERFIPQGRLVSVTGTSYDFQQSREIGATVMDTCFGDLIFDEDGFARVELVAPNGLPKVIMYLDTTHQYLQVCTGDAIAEAEQRRRALVIEPQTCAPNAFNNGYGLRVLQPGQSLTTTWGIMTSREQNR